MPICDVNGNCYKNCSSKAVHIREIEAQMPWYGSNNNLIFSDQTGLATKFKSLEEINDKINGSHNVFEMWDGRWEGDGDK